MLGKENRVRNAGKSSAPVDKKGGAIAGEEIESEQGKIGARRDCAELKGQRKCVHLPESRLAISQNKQFTRSK